ncbi:uncharacterized protein ACR2FA_010803 [Aphomia sociella]
MPEDKKNQSKGKNDPKEQRKPRHGSRKAAEKKTTHVDNKITPVEKTAERPQVTEPQKPVYEDPGPEFYKNLKRETDDILKITEEANSKYKKKEIQSNWSKYEMPIDSYDDIEEQENMGADYEKLIEMPLSIGGHFQFKHEKSWDVNTGPSLYDKYFEINMNDLANALSTLPFYERNNIDKDIFTSSDILTMDTRAIKYKRKYYNDNSYTTTELKVLDKTISNLKEDVYKTEPVENIDKSEDIEIEKNDELQLLPKCDEVEPPVINECIEIQPQIEVKAENISTTDSVKENIEFNSPIYTTELKTTQINTNKVMDDINDLILDSGDLLSFKKSENIENITEIVLESKLIKAADLSTTPEQPKNPIIESPEDLEKWLDDFLDD